jgi:phospholipid transport system substrate-binding protein
VKRIRPPRLLLTAVASALLATCAPGLACAVNQVAAVDTSNPSALVNSVAHALLTPIDAHRDQYRNNPAKLDKLLDDVLLPHLDTRFAARLVLGPYWRSATDTQRTQFIDGFYHSLIHNYSTQLVDFSLNRLKVLPSRSAPDASYATVDTVVLQSDGDRTSVRYSLRHTKNGWKIYDVTFGGVSYLQSFHDDFREEIEQKGLDELITRLQHEYG